MLHLMNTSAPPLSLTITEGTFLVVCLCNLILRVLLKVTKLKPLEVGFHLLKDEKDTPLRMTTHSFKILNTLTMTVTVIAQLNSPPNLKTPMMMTAISNSSDGSESDNSALLYADDDDRTVYVRIGYGPDDNEPVYVDLDKTPPPILPREKVFFDVEEVEKDEVVIPQESDFLELKEDLKQQESTNIKDMVNGKTVFPNSQPEG